MSLIDKRLFDHDAQAVELSQYIPEVVSDVLYAFSYNHVTPNYQVDTIHLDTKLAISLGLILTELVTNACKYAFPDHPGPTLTVFCQRRGKSVELIVADNGPGFDFSVSPPSLGLSLIGIQVEQLPASSRSADRAPPRSR